MILLILKNKGSYIEVTRRLEDRATNKIWNTITKTKRSSSTGWKDQTKKVLDEDKSLTKNSYLILREGSVIVSILLFSWTFQQLYLLVEVTLEKEEALLPLGYSHQKMWEIWKKMVKQASRCPQMTRWWGCWSITCYCGKWCWCYFELCCEICCWTYTGYNCLPCRAYWGYGWCKKWKIKNRTIV